MSLLYDGLPGDILDQILDQVILLSDFIRFGTVCKTWHAIFLQKKRRRMEQYSNEVPLLFIPPPAPSSNNNNIEPNQLFNILENKCYNSMFPLTPCRQVLGASHGWLLTIIRENGGDTFIILKNPMTGNTISLPPLGLIIDNIVLSCNPSLYPDECVVAYSTIHAIGFIKCGKTTWNNFTMDAIGIIESILFHKGQLYVLDSHNNLYAIHLRWESNNSGKCDFRRHLVQLGEFGACQELKLYLVESVGGELLKIEKNKDTGYTMHMDDVKVYKLEGHHWVRIHRLGNGEVLFLVDCNCNAICSKSPSLQPHSVYAFYTYVPEGPFEIRIISLNEKRRPIEKYFGVALRYSLEPLWIHPTLQ